MRKFSPGPCAEVQAIDCIDIFKDESLGNRLDKKRVAAAYLDMLKRCFKKVQPLLPFSGDSLADLIKIF